MSRGDWGKIDKLWCIHLRSYAAKKKKNELSLVLTIGCPGAIWGKDNIQQSHLTSPPPRKF